MSEQKHRTGGRPPLKPGERAQNVMVYLTESDRETLHELGAGNYSRGAREAISLARMFRSLIAELGDGESRITIRNGEIVAGEPSSHAFDGGPCERGHV